MKKQIKVLTTAALLAMGASFTAMAAETYDWQQYEGSWICYDKNGDLYEDAWVKDGNEEYYVDGDGYIVYSDWVEGEGSDMYYVTSNGTKAKNQFRLLTPYDDEDAEAKYYYFNAKGKMVTDAKVVYKNNTYYFDGDGEMLTGWIDTTDSNYEIAQTGAVTSKLVYCYEEGEDIGARANTEWVETYEPGADLDEVEIDDLNWYHIKSTGAATTGKASDIEGKTYFFGADGKMLSGWVAKIATGNATAGDYEEINWDVDTATAEKLTTGDAKYSEVYFCDVPEKGYAKKNRWIKTWPNTNYDDQDLDNSTYWFWFDKYGRLYTGGSTTPFTAQKLKFVDGEQTPAENEIITDNNSASTQIESTAVPANNNVFTADTDLDGLMSDETGDFNAYAKEINGKTYIFNENGVMQTGFLLDYYSTSDAKLYYIDADGERVTGSHKLADNSGVEYNFYFGSKTENGYKEYAAINGNRSGKLYKNGLLTKAINYDYDLAEVQIDGVYYGFIVDKNGKIQTKLNTTYSNATFGDEVYVSSGTVDKANLVFATAANATGATNGYVASSSNPLNW